MWIRKIETNELIDFYKCYLDSDYGEFFRRFPADLNFKSFENMETWLPGTIFSFGETEIYGFASLSQIDAYGKSAQLGILVFKKHRDLYFDSEKASNYFTRQFLNFVFKRIDLNKVFFTFLSSRKRIEEDFIKNGFLKEGDFKQNVFYNGEYKDEVSYSILRKNYLKEGV